MLQPLRDVIAVIPLEEKQMIGSLYIPDQGKQRTDQGIILYRGPLCKTLRVGDHVFFSGYTGTKVTIEPQGELIFMREVDVFFFEDGRPTELMIPQSLLKNLITEAGGRIFQHMGVLHKDTPEARQYVMEVVEQLEAFIDNRLAAGLEF